MGPKPNTPRVMTCSASGWMSWLTRDTLWRNSRSTSTGAWYGVVTGLDHQGGRIGPTTHKEGLVSACVPLEQQQIDFSQVSNGLRSGNVLTSAGKGLSSPGRTLPRNAILFACAL